MEEEDPQNDGEEPANCSHDFVSGHPQPLLKKDRWAGHNRGGEEDVVYGRDYGGVIDVKSFVQVTDLNADTDYQADD